jgi:uncharacterized protein DUF2877
MENRGVLRGVARPSGATPAASLSTLLEPLFDTAVGALSGRVLSVHASAVNLVVDGSLVTIATVTGGGLPNGILVGAGFTPRSVGIRAGMAVTVANDRVEFEDGRFAVAVREARRWSPRLAAMARPTEGEVRLRVGVAAGATAHRARALDGIVPWGEAFAALRHACRAGSEQAIFEAGRALAGLGAGLTPAGDDVLVGFTAGLTALGDGRAGRLGAAWAGYAVGRTTLVAESFHRHAAEGAYSERLHDVLRAILVGPVQAIPAAILAATAWGATSGADTLAGILLGLAPTRASASRVLEIGAA